MTAVVAVCAVVVACGFVLLAMRRAHVRAERRLEAVLLRIDGHLEAMSASVARAVERAVGAGASTGLPALTLDFDDLAHSLVTEAAIRTGADALVLRIEGPGGRPIITSYGAGIESEGLERSFGPPGDEPFRAAVIDWTYSPSGEAGDLRFHSALVTPLVATTGVPGTLAAYSLARGAFRPEHAAALGSLLEETAVALTNAKRFAEIEARVNLDPATGVPNRRGYELELGREVARARRTGKPLSIVLVAMADADESPSHAGGIGDLARMVTRMTRGSDISCRRGERQLAILLPGTREPGASTLTSRLEREVRRGVGPEPSTVTVGIVEWQTNESSESLDARVDRALARPRIAPVALLDDARGSTTSGTVQSTLASGSEVVRPGLTDLLRHDTLDTISREVAEARRFGRALALVAMDVEGLDEFDSSLGRERADALLVDVAGRFDRSLGSGSAHRLGPSTFVLVLPGSGVDDAEALVDALQSSLEPPHHDVGIALSAGITELDDGDDANAFLGRAEHALWQAGQARSGTVVVAVPNRRPSPPD